jgi:hypothetical protein
VKIAKISAVKRIQSDPYIALGFTLNRLELILGGLYSIFEKSASLKTAKNCIKHE